MRAQFRDYTLPIELPERQAVRDAVNTRAAVWENPGGATHEKAAREWRDAWALILTEISK